MPRQAFNTELERLKDELLIMSSMTTHALRESVRILKKQDLIDARRLIKADKIINARRYNIEESALMLIATQQPTARDMRLIAAFIELVGELERIADYAKGIARISVYIGRNPFIKPLIHIPQMSEAAIQMLEDAIDAFIRSDVDAAYVIASRDDYLDDLYNKIQGELLALMIENSSSVEQSNHLLWAAHNLERVGDRVVNICERIIFTVKGEFVELNDVLKRQKEEVGG